MSKIGKVGIGVGDIFASFLKTAAPNPPPGQAGAPKAVIPAGGQPVQPVAPAAQAPVGQPAVTQPVPVQPAQPAAKPNMATMATGVMLTLKNAGISFINEQALKQFLESQFEANGAFGATNLAGKPKP